MKTFKILLLITFVILSGFSKDSQTGKNEIVKNKTEAGVVKLVKIWGQTIDLGGTMECTPLGIPGNDHTQFGLLKGHQTHGGKIIPELSPWEITSCNTDFNTMVNVSIIHGTVTVANGDSYFYDCIMTVNLADKSVVMDINVTDGTGKFEGIFGDVLCTGSLDGVVTFCGEGFITYPK